MRYFPAIYFFSGGQTDSFVLMRLFHFTVSNPFLQVKGLKVSFLNAIDFDEMNH